MNLCRPLPWLPSPRSGLLPSCKCSSRLKAGMVFFFFFFFKEKKKALEINRSKRQGVGVHCFHCCSAELSCLGETWGPGSAFTI